VTVTSTALLAQADPPTLADFGSDPIWLVIAKAIAMFVFLLVMTIFVIWFERRIVAFMQQRVGPNRAGPFGILQTLADGFKLAFKEGIKPRLADVAVYIIAPLAAAIPAILAWAVIPLGPTVSIFGTETPLQVADLPVAVLFVLAMAAIGVYGVVLSGWSSGSTYSLLGSMRGSAQVISYEIGMGLAVVGVVLYAGSLSTSEIVAAQTDGWYLIVLPVSFVLFWIAGLGETNRAPFDMPEGESEIVGGFHTEYSSLRFAMFFLGEYIALITIAAMSTTLFLGGWLPFWPFSMFEWAYEGWIPVVWFILKVLAGVFFFIWARASLPRFKYDRFMVFGWKVMIPVGLGWVMIVASARVLVPEYLSIAQYVLFIGVPLLALLLLGTVVHDRGKARRATALEQEVLREPSFPVPPLDLVVPRSHAARRTAAGSVEGTARETTVMPFEASTEPPPPAEVDEADGPDDGEAPRV
jgi:NADH-quinone oxidoreductase subunit H